MTAIQEAAGLDKSIEAENINILECRIEKSIQQ
jgi:hypothetical protein